MILLTERRLRRLAVGDRLCAVAIFLTGLAGNILLWLMIGKYFA